MANLNQQEKVKFSQIMFQSQGRQEEEINKLDKEEISKLKEYYAQKIIYDSVNGHIRPPPQQIINPQQGPPTGLLGTVCCCFYPEEHRQKFDVRSSLFIKRCLGAFLFFKSNFLQIGQNRIELYGPVWVTIAYSIILALAGNLNQYFVSPTGYVFSKLFLTRALGVTFIFKLLEPLVLAAVMGCLDAVIQRIQVAMLTGYSVMLYIIPTIICSVPSLYLHVAMLAIAGILRAIFLFRNLSTKLTQRKFVILGVALIIQAFYCFVIIKTIFPKQAGYSFQSGTNQVLHLEVSLRHFNEG